MKPTHIILTAIVAVVALLAVVFRYEVIPDSRVSGYYKVDRWTGETTVVRGTSEKSVMKLVPYHGELAPLEPTQK